MKFIAAVVFSLSALLMVGAPSWATAGEQVVSKAQLKWKDLGNGIAAAPVSGDMATGPSRFFLKYPVGLVTPSHHHDADHYVTLMSGAITLTVAGKEYRLGPGDYFALTDKVPHVAKVEGNEEAVFFIQADGPWNVVMEK
ncbi:cupin domain-containing protein [Aeromonas tecta]|uniref:cupin domain-containing protein n=1 Tax=Aeromonas tecta TaxID=324617 RepID=UPI000680DB0D|nr:cupin domain-containing protein [Aeromonas tecta]